MDAGPDSGNIKGATASKAFASMGPRAVNKYLNNMHSMRNIRIVYVVFFFFFKYDYMHCDIVTSYIKIIHFE